MQRFTPRPSLRRGKAGADGDQIGYDDPSPGWLRVAGLACGVGLALGAGAARADCVSDCDAATYCDSEMQSSGECARKLNDCYISECSRSGTRYGAIAYGAKSGAAGWAYDFDDGDSAERFALSKCGEHGEDCRAVVTFSNACAAVAAAGEGFAAATGPTQDDAQGRALAACRKKSGGTTCEIQAWSCSFP
jgi:hypothetical protein